jgi:hypothetical protein
MQQHEQSSVLMQEHLPPCGLTIEPVEIEEVVEAGIVGVYVISGIARTIGVMCVVDADD